MLCRRNRYKTVYIDTTNTLFLFEMSALFLCTLVQKGLILPFTGAN